MIKSKNKFKNIKCIEWMIPSTCNYHCSYCLTKRAVKKHAVHINYKIFLEQFKKLPGTWDVVLSGTGEPFLIPDFLKIVKGIVDIGHKVNITSNISCSIKKIEELLIITGDKLVFFDASYHPEFAEFDDFLNKITRIKKMIGNSLVVSMVNSKTNNFMKKRVSRVFKEKSIKFNLKAVRGFEGSKEILNEKKQIKNNKKLFNNKKILLNSEVNFFNTMCFSGNKFFVICENGDAWKCWNSVRENNYLGAGFLGNCYKETLRIKDRPERCKFKECNYAVAKLFRIYNKKNE